MGDLLVVLAGQPRVACATPVLEQRTLRSGDALVLPAHPRCRPYRWPRDPSEVTGFLAIYPHAATGGTRA
jgi:hypothetical protein